MLTEIYIEALLVDEELADQVWEASETGHTFITRLATLRADIVVTSTW